MHRLILVATPGGGGTALAVVHHEAAGVRQMLIVRRIPAVSDERIDMDVPVDDLRAGIELFIGAAATILGTTTGATSAIVLGAVLYAAASAALSVGLSLLSSAIFGQKGSEFGGPPTNVPVRQIVKQATPRQRFIYGRALVGGAYCYLNKNPPYLLAQFLVAAHPCDALEAVYINGFRCEFNSNGEAVTPRFRKGGVPYMEISTRLGDPDQAIDPLLAAEFPDVPTTFRQRGQTVVTIKAYYGTDYDDHEETFGQGTAFHPLFLMRGKPVHDPRVYSSDPDDSTTWSWSQNWALCIADWMVSAAGGRKKTTQVDYDAIAAEATICDRSIGTSDGGSERQYTLNGGFASDENPFQIAESMLASAGEAACLWRRGQFAPQVDVPRTAVRTLTEADLVAGFTFRSARARNEVLNTVRSEFIYPDRGYVAAMSPPLSDAALLASDGQPLERTVRRPFVAGEERAQRLDKITLKRSRLGRELRITVGIEHLALEVGDHVNIQFETFPAFDGTYVIRQATAGGMLRTLELVLQQAATAEVHEWSTSEVQDTTVDEIINPEAL